MLESGLSDNLCIPAPEGSTWEMVVPIYIPAFVTEQVLSLLLLSHITTSLSHA